MDETLVLEFDGGSRGNPGPAGVGVVVRAADNTPLVTLGRFIGRATNNVAEYRALILAMQEAKKLGARKVLIRGDSELIIKQMNGEYRVKHPDMRLLYDDAQQLIRHFAEARITHNLRHKNELADKLANLAMDRRSDVLEADEPSQGSNAAADPVDSLMPRAGEQLECPRCRCQIEVKIPPDKRTEKLRPFVCVCGTKMQP